MRVINTRRLDLGGTGIPEPRYKDAGWHALINQTTVSYQSNG